MAASPQFKIYNLGGEYVAACKLAEDAACLAALYGNGATVRYGHSSVIWREGQEEQPAGESYDHAAAVMYERIDANNRKHFERQ